MRTAAQACPVEMLDLAIGDNCHRLQASDALGERRMRAEETAEKFAGREWRDNAERGRGRRDVHGDALVVGAELFEGADQAVRMTDHLRAGSVGLKFALAGNPELQEQRANRR